MTTKNKALAGLASASILLAQALATPSLGLSAPRLTKASAEALARRDALAGFGINGGDKVQATCHAIRGGAYSCQMLLIPVKSSSRCRWTETIRIVKGKPDIKYARVACKG
jgi:hypothetical protein